MFQQFTNNFRQMLQSGDSAQPAGASSHQRRGASAFSALKATFTSKGSSSQESGEPEPQADKPADGTGGKR